MGLNKTILSGRLTADVQLRYGSANQTAVAKFCLAVDDGYGDKKTTSFINCVAFGKTAENIEMSVGKGCRIGVEGRLKSGSYTKDDGTKVYTLDVYVDKADFIDWKATKEKPGNAHESFQDFQAISEECPF